MLKLLVEIVQGACVAAVLVGAALMFSAGVTLMVAGVVVFALLEARGMTLLRREVRSLPQTPGLVEMLRRVTPMQYGLPATEQDALTHSAVFQCVNLIANTVAAFPADVYRKDPTGFPALVTDRRAIIDMPSTEIDPINWRRVVIVSWLLRGNAYGLVSSLRGAYPTGIELIHPDRVTVDRVRPDAPVQFYLDRKPVDRWPLGPLWHAPGVIIAPGSPLGVSVLQQAMMDVGLGLAARKFAAQTFTSNGIPTAVLMNDKATNEDGAKRVKDRFMDAMAGTREPVVFSDGWKYEQIQVSAEESQFLSTIKANKSDVAGFFGVPGEMVGGDKSSMTYSNVEGRGIDLLRFCINWWVGLMDQCLTQLLVRPEYVKLDVDDLLRADMQTRYTSYAEGIRAGFLSPDDARRREGYKPISDGKGDQYNWPPYANKDQNTQADAAAVPAPQPASMTRDETRSLDEREHRLVASEPHITIENYITVEPTPIENVVNVAAAMPSDVVITVEPTPIENVINVEAPDITVEPTPIEVNVEAPNVVVQSPRVDVPVTVTPAAVQVIEREPGTKTVHRDSQGRIVSITES